MEKISMADERGQMQWPTFLFGAVWGAAIVQGVYFYGWELSLGLALGSVVAGMALQAWQTLR